MNSEPQDDSATRFECKVCGQAFAKGVVVCPQDGTMLTPAAADPMVGTILADRYEILALVGAGGMGKVYKARHVLMDRVVALKMLHAHLIADAITLQRFQQEAKACSQLSHPNVVAVFDFGVSTQGQPYLVMDFLEGTALNEEIRTHKFLPVERALPIFTQICDGLGHAHQKGIVHRDLKPGNVVLIKNEVTDDFVKVVDFGIAKLLSPTAADSMHLTKTGEVFGSPLYMSPEQCMALELDNRTDIYTLGCVMYETLTGAAPLVGKHLLHTIQMHIDEMPPPIARTNPDASVPPELEEVILTAMAKNPDNRYQTMADLKKDLLAFVLPGAVPTAAPAIAAELRASAVHRPVSPSAPEAQPAGAREQVTGGGPAPARPWLIAVTVGLAVLLVVGGGLTLWLAPSPFHSAGDADVNYETAWTKYNDLFKSALKSGDNQAAETCINQAIDAGSRLAEPKLRCAQSLADKGEFLTGLKRYSEAELTLEKSFAIRKKADSLENPDALEGLRALAKVYELDGKFDYAAFRYKQLLDIQKTMFGPDDLELAKTLGALARTNMAGGKTGEAVAQFKLAWDIIQKHPKTRDPALGTILQTYADELAREGKGSEADKVRSLERSLVGN